MQIRVPLAVLALVPITLFAQQQPPPPSTASQGSPMGALAPPAPVAHVMAIDDVTVECDAAGNWIRLYATGSERVKSAEPARLNEAKTAAASAAASRLTKFFEQDPSSPNLPKKFQEALARDKNAAQAMPAEAQQRLVSAIVELVRAYRNRTLAEVRFAAPTYDPKKQEVLVRMGLTREPAAMKGAAVANLPAAPPAPGSPVPVGGQVKEPTLVKHVPPVYPSLAQSAHFQGAVVLEVIVGTDGKVANATVVQSKPLLDQAALDAVRQWEYTPTLINGVAVPVLITVTVHFTLK